MLPFVPKAYGRLLPGKIMGRTPTSQEMLLCLPASENWEEAPPACRAVGNSWLTLPTKVLPSTVSSVRSFYYPWVPKEETEVPECKRVAPGSAVENQQTWIRNLISEMKSGACL